MWCRRLVPLFEGFKCGDGQPIVLYPRNWPAKETPHSTLGPNMAIVIVSVFFFAIALIAGRWSPKARIWDHADIVYYPLSALGIILLFLNNTNQRKALQLAQEGEQLRAELQSLASSKPDVRLNSSIDVLNSSIGIIKSISTLAQACGGISARSPSCIAPIAVAPSIDVFLAKTEATYKTPEVRLSSIC